MENYGYGFWPPSASNSQPNNFKTANKDSYFRQVTQVANSKYVKYTIQAGDKWTFSEHSNKW